MKKLLFLVALAAIGLLVACGGATAESVPTAIPGGSPDAAGPATIVNEPIAATEEDQAAATAIAEAIVEAEPVTALTTDYQDALPLSTQLAVGILQLEGSERAVTEAQAASLLPLWQVLSSLQASGTAAQVELDAVVNQIQSALTPDQLGAIAALKLTADSLTDLMSSGGFGFGRRGQNGGLNGENFEAFPGGAPPEGFVPPAGGGMGPGGGAGPGAGFGPGGGAGAGGELGGIDPAMMATRQAELASGENSDALDQVAISMVVRLLQMKTGEFTGMPGGGFYGVLITAIAEATGLDEMAVREELQAGKTPIVMLEEHGVDSAGVREAVIAALADTPLAENQDLGAVVDEMLSGSLGDGPAMP